MFVLWASVSLYFIIGMPRFIKLLGIECISFSTMTVLNTVFELQIPDTSALEILGEKMRSWGKLLVGNYGE